MNSSGIYFLISATFSDDGKVSELTKSFSFIYLELGDFGTETAF